MAYILVKEGNSFNTNSRLYYCDTVSELNKIKTENSCPIGTSVFVIKTNQTYMIDSTGNWNIVSGTVPLRTKLFGKLFKK